MVRKVIHNGSTWESDGLTLTIVCYDFRTIELTFTGMDTGVALQKLFSQFGRKRGYPTATTTVGNHTEVKAKGVGLYVLILQ